MVKPSLYSKGNFERELESFVKKGKDYRSPFRKDYGRLLHCPSFRRLQGKTQLFPGVESDYFRNRLTHSLEVAQIAKSIALHLNLSSDILIRNNCEIDTDLVEFAALAHDLGHPPFGHNGEQMLDKLMYDAGGYEGNAQTLRILTKIEKRYYYDNDPNKFSDFRCGLNLTYRTLASILKYDRIIPEQREEYSGVQKGYYEFDKNLVKKIKHKVTGHKDFSDKFKTIECYIMDIADDIAYCTYDLEDTLKAGFINFIDLVGGDEDRLEEVAKKVERNMKKENYNVSYSVEDLIKITFRALDFNSYERLLKNQFDKKGAHLPQIAQVYEVLKFLSNDGHYRSRITSNLVQKFINGVSLKFNKDIPALSQVYLKKKIREEVEVLKNFIYVSQIESPRLRLAEFRGKEIVREIYNNLYEGEGYNLMPEDYVSLYSSIPLVEKKYKRRIICDFIAGMTDKYAIEFYGRLKSENAQTIFKPF